MQTYHNDPQDEITVSIVRHVAALKDTTPLDLPPIESAVNADLLKRVRAHDADSNTTLAFEYAGFKISVSPDETTVSPVE